MLPVGRCELKKVRSRSCHSPAKKIFTTRGRNQIQNLDVNVYLKYVLSTKRLLPHKTIFLILADHKNNSFISFHFGGIINHPTFGIFIVRGLFLCSITPTEVRSINFGVPEKNEIVIFDFFRVRSPAAFCSGPMFVFVESPTQRRDRSMRCKNNIRVLLGKS